MARSTYYYLVNKEEVDVVAIRNEPVLKEIKIIFNENKQIVDKTTKISMNILMFWSFFKKNKPYD